MRKTKANRILGTLAAVLVFFLAWLVATEGHGAAAAGTADHIEGVVASSKGTEAGVWVIAETTDLPTRFIKIVVTDDQGRYVLPDLPQASYQVFVRGYGLVDSARTPAKPGQRLDLKAVIAKDGRAAAQVYPANYWLSLLAIPKGNLSDEDVVIETKECFSCHQVGDVATREFPKSLGSFKSSVDAWDHRMAMGPNASNMSAIFVKLGEQRKAFADWTDRVAAGAYPKAAPPRPTGVERNLVISMWDWALPTSRRSDMAATDERTPTMNANGLIYGAIQSSDILAVLDSSQNATTAIKIPSNAPQVDTNTPTSPYWGDEKIWQRQSDPRSVAMDSHGRVWVTARTRAAKDQPDFCKDGSLNKFAKYFPLPGPSARQIEVYDPKTQQFTLIDSCFAQTITISTKMIRWSSDRPTRSAGWTQRSSTKPTTRHPRRDGAPQCSTRMVTARSQSGPSRISRLIPTRTTASTLVAIRTPSAQSMGACGARESGPEIRRSCASSADRNRHKRARERCTCRPRTRCRCPARAA